MESEGRCNQQHAPCQTETIKMTRNCSRVRNLHVMYSYIFSPFAQDSFHRWLLVFFFAWSWSELLDAAGFTESRLSQDGLNATRHGKAGLSQACKPLRTQKFNPHPSLPHVRPCAAAPNLSCSRNADSKSFESSTEGPGPVTPTSTGTCWT